MKTNVDMAIWSLIKALLLCNLAILIVNLINKESISFSLANVLILILIFGLRKNKERIEYNG